MALSAAAVSMFLLIMTKFGNVVLRVKIATCSTGIIAGTVTGSEDRSCGLPG